MASILTSDRRTIPHRSVLLRRRLLAVLTSVLLFMTGAPPLHAVVYQAESDGFGLSAQLSIAGLQLVNTGELGKASGAAPSVYNQTVSALPLNLTVGVLGTNLLRVSGTMQSSAQSAVDGSPGMHATGSTGSVQNLSLDIADTPLLSPLISISANVLSSQAQSSGDTAGSTVTGSSILTNLTLKISGVTINLASLGVAVNPAPNTVVNLSAAGLAGAMLYLNEQTPVSGSSGTEIEVTALRLKISAVSAPGFGLLAGEIKAGVSYVKHSVAQKLQVQKQSDVTEASVNTRQIFNFRLGYSCSATGGGATGAVFSDVLDPSLEMVALQGSAHTSAASYNSATRTVTFTFNNPLPAGASGELVIQARFALATPEGTVASNFATMTATTADTVTTNTVTVRAVDPAPTPGGISSDKYAPASVLQSAPYMDYWIAHGNTGASGENLTSYVVEDTLPSGMTAAMITTDQYAGAPSLPVTVRYKTNLNSSWRQWGTGALYDAAQASRQIPASDLGLPSAEKVTALRFEYGTLLGASHNRASQTAQLGIRVALQQSPMIASGTTVQNCADITSTGKSARSCADTLIAPAQGNPVMRQEISSGDVEYLPGEILGIRLVFGLDSDSSQALTDPVIAVLIPSEMEYQGPWSVAGAAWQNAGSPAPRFERIDSFANTGQTLLRWSWTAAHGNSFTMPAIQTVSETRILYSLKVRSGVPQGSWLQTMRGNWTQPADHGLALSYAADNEGYVSGITSSGGSSAPDPMADWNLVSFTDLSTSSQVQGRTFIGRNLTSPHAASFATGLTGVSSADFAVAAGRNIASGDPLQVSAGSLRLKGLTNGRTISFSGGGALTADPSVDVSAIQADLQNRSAAYHAMAANGTVVPPGPGSTLILRAPAGASGQTVVFNSTAAALFANAAAQQIDLEANGAAAIIVNVSGVAAAWTHGSMSGTLADPAMRSKVLWNFYEAASVSLGSRSLSGSLLAPYASVVTNGPVYGSVAAESVTTGGMISLPAFTASPANTLSGSSGSGSGAPPSSPVQVAECRLFIRTGAAMPFARLETGMWFRGEKDSTWLQFPSTGLSTPGGRMEYRLQVRNTGDVSMKNLVIMDILPALGDTGVISTNPRGSQWTPFLTGQVTAPVGVTVSYSTSGNPCRTEFIPSGPAGCEDPHWTSAPPSDITSVRSLKFDYGPIEVAPEAESIITWSMRAPWNAPAAGEVAWNSYAFTSVRSDNDEAQPLDEPWKTGFILEPPLQPFYGDRVWLDTDKDGVQDAGEPGVNGLLVELYRDNGDNVPDISVDALIATTVTSSDASGPGSWLFGNMGTGRFFAAIRLPETYGASPADQGGDDTADSDGNSITVRGGRAAVMPVTELTDAENDRSWDQGVVDRSGIPAVWTLAKRADGKIMLGGRFGKSHGVTRNNIARVEANGSLDTSFNPGSGFNGTVRSVAVLGDGSICAGGEFTSYNGQGASGLAFVNAAGQLVSAPHTPDRPQVNWVGVASNALYFAGEFTRVGGVACGNVAKLGSNRQIDPSFVCTVGANGRINDGFITGSGRILLCGNFTTFGGTQRGGIVRLLTTGALDVQFNPGTGANGEVCSITPIEDGRMVLTGTFTSFNGVPCNGAVRLTENGAIDSTFGRSALAVDSVNTSN